MDLGPLRTTLCARSSLWSSGGGRMIAQNMGTKIGLIEHIYFVIFCAGCKVAIQQLRKLGSALARHTGTDESESINHLMTRTSILLQKGLSALLLNRIPNHPTPDIGGEL